MVKSTGEALAKKITGGRQISLERVQRIRNGINLKQNGN